VPTKKIVDKKSHQNIDNIEVRLLQSDHCPLPPRRPLSSFPDKIRI